MGHIREKMKADLKLRGLATSTQEAYLHYAHNFVAYQRRSPTEMGEQQIRDFLLHLVAEKRAGRATQHMYVAAIKFLYTTTLVPPSARANIPWPNSSPTVPELLTGRKR